MLDQGAHSGHELFSSKFRIKWLLWNVDMHVDSPGSHKGRVPLLGRGIFHLNFRIMWLLRSGLILGRGIFAVNFLIKWLL